MFRPGAVRLAAVPVTGCPARSALAAALHLNIWALASDDRGTAALRGRTTAFRLRAAALGGGRTAALRGGWHVRRGAIGDVVATAAVNRRNVCTRRRCDGGDVVHASGVRLQNRERHDVGLGQHSTVEVCDDACREVCDTNLLSIRVGHDRTGVDEVIPGSVLQVENVVDSLETDVVTKYNCSCKEVDIADEQVTGQIHDIDVRRIRNRCDKANLDACLVCNGQVTIAKVNTVSRQKPSIVARRNGRLLLRNAIIAAGRWLVV